MGHEGKNLNYIKNQEEYGESKEPTEKFDMEEIYEERERLGYEITNLLDRIDKKEEPLTEQDANELRTKREELRGTPLNKVKICGQWLERKVAEQKLNNRLPPGQQGIY